MQQQTWPGGLRHLSLRVLGLILLGILAASCGSVETVSAQTTRVVPQPVDPQGAAPVATAVPLAEPTVAPDQGDGTSDEAQDGQATEPTVEPQEPEAPRIRSFQEFLPDPASVEERYGDGGLWTLTDIRYLEPGPRVGLPCGDTEPPDFDGIEAVYTNLSGENLLVMVQNGEGVEIWMQGLAEGVLCTELGIRQSALTIPGMDQSVVLEMDPAAPAASMAVAGSLQGDVFISFIAGAVSPESPVADPNPLVDFSVAMFERINAAQ